MFNLLRSCRYTHISILRKYNMKNHHRYQHADKWVADHNYQKIKTYKDFITKSQQVSKVQLTLSEHEEQYIREVYDYQRKDIAWTKQLGLKHYRLDDLQLQQSIEGKTLVQFIKQGVKERKPHQKLFFLGIAAIIINSFLYFYFWFGSQDQDYVANQTLNPEILQTYSLRHIEPHLKQYKRKMGVYLQQIYENQNNLKDKY